MKRLIWTLAIAVAAALWVPVAAQAEFGLSDLKFSVTKADGSPETQAGAHPFALTTSFDLNYEEEGGEAFTEGRFKDFVLGLIEGMAGDTTAYPRCSTLDFLSPSSSGEGTTNCPRNTAVGVTANSVTEPTGWEGSPVYNVDPPPGVVLRLGFRVLVVNLLVDVSLKHSPPFNPTASVRNTPEALYVFSNKTQLWGNPSAPAHDNLRGECYGQSEDLPLGEEFEFEDTSGPLCPVAPNPRPFLTLPTRCEGQNLTSFSIDSWDRPGAFLANGDPDLADPNWVTAALETESFKGCEKLGFSPSANAKPSTLAAQSPTGLDFSLEVTDEGLTSVGVPPPPDDVATTAKSDIKKTVVTLPEGMTANPSLAEGLEVCSQADLARETASSPPGAGCPEASKIGTIEVESPLVSEALKGSLYQATPYENEFNTLIAFYFVIKNPNLGVVVTQAVKVTPDPQAGQLVATADNIPQFPLSRIAIHLREGGRSPLISPPKCGTYQVRAQMFPWSGGAPVESTPGFEITTGPDGSSCPAGGVAPFKPGFEAGTVNNGARLYSPFYMRLSRKDGEQDMTKFSTVLPPGVLAKLAGVGKCSEAAIASAKARTGPHGGAEELANPSCPASSRIGRTLAGAGVGSQLTFVGGSLYLAGPVGGDPLSVVAITPAVAGPFDAGTVVVRVALTVNPLTAEAEVDGSRSDPLPHILKGIPLNVRDLRVYVDRPEFTLNATNCDAAKVRATLFGSFLSPLDPADDAPVGLEASYQAANCAALGFKPKLSLSLKGGTKRGAHPAFRAVYKPRPDDVNLKELVLRLPHSAFLDQGHIRTICTRVQFAADACPKAAQYGEIKAWTPLLDDPLQGPVYLRSSSHKLPDLVFDLHGLVDIEVVSRLDSIHGGIRARIESAPDAPITKVDLQMQGANKGLIVNSRNICATKNRSNLDLIGQSGKPYSARPVLRPSCKGARKGRRQGRG